MRASRSAHMHGRRGADEPLRLSFEYPRNRLSTMSVHRDVAWASAGRTEIGGVIPPIGRIPATSWVLSLGFLGSLPSAGGESGTGGADLRPAAPHDTTEQMSPTRTADPWARPRVARTPRFPSDTARLHPLLHPWWLQPCARRADIRAWGNASQRKRLGIGREINVPTPCLPPAPMVVRRYRPDGSTSTPEKVLPPLVFPSSGNRTEALPVAFSIA